MREFVLRGLSIRWLLGFPWSPKLLMITFLIRVVQNLVLRFREFLFLFFLGFNLDSSGQWARVIDIRKSVVILVVILFTTTPGRLLVFLPSSFSPIHRVILVIIPEWVNHLMFPR